ncbi:MAG: hypothetical protein ACOX5R_09305 [bacterium]
MKHAPLILLLLAASTLPAAADAVRVALLPLQWSADLEEDIRTRFRGIPETTRQVIYDSFSVLGYEDVPPDIVDHWITNDQIVRSDWSSLVDYGVDAVLRGEITQISISRGGLVGRTAAGLRLQLINIPSGEVVWQAEDSASRTGGFILNSGQLVHAFGALGLSRDEGLTEYAFVLRDMLLNMLESVPQVAVSLDPPQLSTVQVFPVNQSTGTGTQGILVQASGDPGCKMFFAVPQNPTPYPMLETAPGQYYGYAAIAARQIAAEPIVVRIANHYGIQTEKEIQ